MGKVGLILAQHHFYSLLIMKIISIVVSFALLLSLNGNEQFCINDQKLDLLEKGEKSFEVEKLMTALSEDRLPSSHLLFTHTLKEIDRQKRELILNDGSRWSIGWLYRNDFQKWQPGNQIKVYYQSGINNIKIENVNLREVVYATISTSPNLAACPFITRFSPASQNPDAHCRIILSNGFILKGKNVNWKLNDALFIFHSEEKNCFDLWNVRKGELSKDWRYLGNEKEGDKASINIEERLKERVLGQNHAVDAISSNIYNYWAGLNDPKAPIGVFLFLGPTGVGKTELAKALTDELYGTRNNLIRFDMSHFVESHSAARLFGSPPGYVNHEEGGQLTEAIRSKPRSIVLLDEMEKAHPAVRKVFLPIFDEGYAIDCKNRRIACNKVIFIMTSNICSSEIAEMFNAGYSNEEVMQAIEPAIIQILSPELYNRVVPIVFRPLNPNMMMGLVDLMLEEVITRLKDVKKINLTIEKSAREYLAEKGFHPTLGARPLKRLIQNKVVAFLSYTIINESIPEGSNVNLSYNKVLDSWHVSWN